LSLIAVAVLGVAIFAVQGVRAASALRDAERVSQELSARIVAGDVPGARDRLAAFDRATTIARESTDGPMWWLGSKLPILGPNIGALRTVSAASDSVADDALPGLVDVADKVRLDAFRPRNGRVDLWAVARALPALVRADRSLSRADARVAAIDPDSLLPMLRDPMGQVRLKSHQAAEAAAAAHNAAVLMPTMLGADGSTRRYLMLVMNNAEVRSLDGMPGSMAVITARRGKLRMGRQGSILDVRPLAHNALPIKPELAGGFESTIATDIRDTTSIPDFPRAAQAAAAIVGKRWKQHYDGVVALDPVALGYVLGGLGSVDAGDRVRLNEYNAANTLLNGVYVRYPDDPNRQDDTFELAARKTFEALVAGRGDSIRTIRGLVRGVQERRVMLWSRRADEQERIRRTGISGSFSRDRRTPEVAFFVDDGASSKMEFYLQMASQLQTVKCYSNGAQALRLTTTLSSEAPDGATLPASVTGTGDYVNPGDMRLHAMIVGPPGGRILAMKVDGRPAPVGANEYRGRPVARVPRILPPGVSTVMIVDLITGPQVTGAPVLKTTPGTVANDDQVRTRAC
jgi:hypothetical protein